MIPSINLVFFSFGWMAAIEIVTLYITIDMPVVRTQIETVGEFTQVFPYINIFFLVHSSGSPVKFVSPSMNQSKQQQQPKQRNLIHQKRIRAWWGDFIFYTQIVMYKYIILYNVFFLFCLRG
jgi:hypothetical protein